MSLLSHNQIMREINQGRLKFFPQLYPDQIRQASVDLTLGNVFRRYRQYQQPIPITEETDYQQYTDELVADSYVLQPHETVLGVTVEKVTLPDDICGWLEGRSRFARMGVLVHISAGLIQPGVSNHQVLEITNLSPNPLELQAGQRICQLAFQRLEGEARYDGKFSQQEKP